MSLENQPVGATPEGNSETPQELNIETADNLGQIREYAKGLKTDLEAYKPTATFVTENFGDLENAKLAHQIYSGFTSEEFNPEEFVKTISGISPQRAEALVAQLAQTQSEKLVQERVEALFGGKADETEIKLFKQWKESGYMMGNEDEELPDVFKFDKEGNPRSDEEIEALTKEFKMIRETQKALKEQTTQKQTQEQQAKEQERQAQVQQAIQEYDNSRLAILEDDLSKFGLNLSDNDTAEQRREKEAIREFILGGVAKLFFSNQELAKDYQTALGHIERGEALLARRYEPRIEKGLLDIIRGQRISKMLESLVPNDPNQPRPEISNSGQATVTGATGKTREERIKSLVASGLLK